MLYSLVLAVHVLVCVVLIIVVLMQSSRGGGLAGAFGGGGDQTVFGGHETATFLSKATTYLAIVFMVLSLSLALMTSSRSDRRAESVIQRSIQKEGSVIPTGQSIDEILGTAPADSAAAGSAPSDSQ